jgi:hypothetical protein
MLAEEPRGDVPDAWPLLAVAYACGDGLGADFASIGAMVRRIQRASFAEAELRAALGRLQAAGLVIERAERFHPTEPVLAFFRGRTHRRGVVHDYEDLQRFLGLDPSRRVGAR